jgi:hypothetical protein
MVCCASRKHSGENKRESLDLEIVLPGYKDVLIADRLRKEEKKGGIEYVALKSRKLSVPIESSPSPKKTTHAIIAR